MDSYSCQKHNNSRHHFFLSYRVQAEGEVVQTLKHALERTGYRFLGDPIHVFRDSDCLTPGTNFEEEYLSALRGSSVIVILLSEVSLKLMIEHTRTDRKDNCLREMQAALALHKQDPKAVSILPVAVMTEVSVGRFQKFEPWNVKIPKEPKFNQLRDALDQLYQIQMTNLHPQKCFENVYPLLYMMKPAPWSESARKAIKTRDKFHVPETSLRRDDLFRKLVAQITVNGLAVISAIGGMGKSTIAKQQHPDFALALNKLGNCANAQQEYDTAVTLYTEALQIYEKVYGRQHDTVATMLRCLGMVANAQNRGSDGEVFLSESAVIFESVFSNTHKDYAATLNNLGNSYSIQGKYEKAIQCYQESLSAKVNLYGKREHSSIATNLHKMGKLAICQNDLSNAEKYLKECQSIREAVFPEERHPERAMVQETLADVYALTGCFEEAYANYAHVYSVYAEVFGETNAMTKAAGVKMEEAKAKKENKSSWYCKLL
ncbi:hypothetical protein CcCBS67573_g03620 [Chytriomyces confervae]|uniref:TIR domain-containing protein n=1 Tax=Chytriomyces confervae TaxID=246404 RepID=A0A507FHI8_9FUNG|nr:hypothetical protein CcCBS67573_g03620 [Chytriomyces confervae]